jgi:hypothetical protein
MTNFCMHSHETQKPKEILIAFDCILFFQCRALWGCKFVRSLAFVRKHKVSFLHIPKIAVITF